MSQAPGGGVLAQSLQFQREAARVLKSGNDMKQVTFLDPREDGRVHPDDVKAAITDRTILVSIMHGNNETGVIQDLPSLAGRLAASRTACSAHSWLRPCSFARPRM